MIRSGVATGVEAGLPLCQSGVIFSYIYTNTTKFVLRLSYLVCLGRLLLNAFN